MNTTERHRHADHTATSRPSLLPRGATGATLLAVGAALAAAALVVRSRTRAAERDNPPAGRFIEVDGVRLHYIERGEGQPLVLLHGNGSMIQDFELSGLVDLAAKKYRVIVFDRPGYGHSDRPRTTLWGPQAQAELLHHALLKLGIEKPIVAGHSWGTLVALSMALTFPDYVKSLVLLSGYYYPTARFDVPLLSPPAIPLIGDVMRYTVSPLLGRLMWPAIVRKLFGPSRTTTRFARFPVGMILRPSQMRASAAETAMMVPAAFRLSKRYAELAMPVVIMAGADDRIVKQQAHSERLHQDVAQSELYLRPGIGHMIHHVLPEDVMAAIDQAADAAHGTPVGAAVPSRPLHAQAAPPSLN